MTDCSNDLVSRGSYCIRCSPSHYTSEKASTSGNTRRAIGLYCKSEVLNRHAEAPTTVSTRYWQTRLHNQCFAEATHCYACSENTMDNNLAKVWVNWSVTLPPSRRERVDDLAI